MTSHLIVMTEGPHCWASYHFCAAAHSLWKYLQKLTRPRDSAAFHGCS